MKRISVVLVVALIFGVLAFAHKYANSQTPKSKSVTPPSDAKSEADYNRGNRKA